MPVTRSRNGSHNPSRGASPVRHGGDDDRSPSPLPLRTSRGRMQTSSAAAKKSAAKSDSPPYGRTIMMTQSSSRAASRGCSPPAAVYARSDADKVKIAAAHYQPFDSKYPDSVRAQSVSRGSDSSGDFSSSRLVRASARGKSVDCSGDVGSHRRSERISSRAQSVEPRVRGVQVKPRGRIAA